MDTKRIISATFSWISVEKAILFLVFFGLSIPFLVFLPEAFKAGAYPGVSRVFASCMYSVLYLAVIFGILILIQFFLLKKKESVCRLSPLKMIDLVFLTFLELFYVFIWNKKVSLRVPQILLLIASALSVYYLTISRSELSLWVAFICLTAYFSIAIYTAVRVFFSTTAFCHKCDGIKESIEESWAITSNKFKETFRAILLSGALVFVLYCLVTLVFGALASLVLKYWFIEPIALSFGFKAASAFALAPVLIAYHYALIEVYLQLSKHKSSSESVRRILSHRVLNPKKAKPKAKKVVKRKR